MIVERTLSIIKPDALEKGCVGKIISRFEEADLHIIAAKLLWLTSKEAEQFYSIHKGKHFFETLIQFITSGPVIALVLEGENAILKNRDIMGATDPRKALSGTLRGDFAKDVENKIERNIVHGSDALETAKIEIPFFFSDREIF